MPPKESKEEQTARKQKTQEATGRLRAATDASKRSSDPLIAKALLFTPRRPNKAVSDDSPSSDDLDIFPPTLNPGLYQQPRAYGRPKWVKPSPMRRTTVTMPVVRAVVHKGSLQSMVKRRSFHIPSRPFSSYLSMPPSSATGVQSVQQQ